MAKSQRPQRSPESSKRPDLPTAEEASPQNEVIPSPIREALLAAGVDPTKGEVRLAVTTLLQASRFAGPIPPAHILAEYDAVRPGLAQEIIGWAQQQQAHRRELELMTFRGSENRMNRGQVFALVIALASLSAAIGSAYFGATLVAVALAIIGIGGPNAATILARLLDRRILSGEPHRRAGSDTVEG